MLHLRQSSPSLLPQALPRLVSCPQPWPPHGLPQQALPRLVSCPRPWPPHGLPQQALPRLVSGLPYSIQSLNPRHWGIGVPVPGASGVEALAFLDKLVGWPLLLWGLTQAP